MKELVPSLVDLPVRVRIWTRPDFQEEQLEILRQVRPSILFLVSDGGRNAKERELIGASRELFESVDWDCEIHKLYWEENLGLYKTAALSRQYIWERVDRCVWLEDDIMPSVGAFRFWAEMLERYKDDTRVLGVCAMNHEGVSEGVNADYFFSREASIWGMATWKRTEDVWGEIDWGPDPYLMERMVENAAINPDFVRRLEGYVDNPRYEGHVPASEFWFAFAALLTNQMYVVPKRNMICNKGCRADSAHTDDKRLLPKGLQRVFDMDTYELEFPIEHPRYVIPDIRYQKAVYRIMGVGHPLVSIHRKASRALRILAFSGLPALRRKLASRKNRMED